MDVLSIKTVVCTANIQPLASKLQVPEKMQTANKTFEVIVVKFMGDKDSINMQAGYTTYGRVVCKLRFSQENRLVE